MKTPNRLNTLLATLALALPVQADILELKNGSILNGKYVGGTGATVRFEALGSLQVIATSDIIALTFTSSGGNPTAPVAVPTTPPPASQPPPAATASAPAPVAPPKQVTLPAGTLLLVRMKDGISSKNKPGTPFTTKIEYDLVVGGTKVVPAGAIIYGKVLSSSQARRALGQSTLDLRLTQIVTGGAPVPVMTTGYKQAGERAIKDAARRSARSWTAVMEQAKVLRSVPPPER